MSPFFRAYLIILCLGICLLSLAQCAMADEEVPENSQKVWDCTEGNQLITMHKKAALCKDGSCIWFNWKSTLLTDDSIMFSYVLPPKGTGLVIQQQFPADNKAHLLVTDSKLGVASATCSYVFPSSG